MNLFFKISEIYKKSDSFLDFFSKLSTFLEEVDNNINNFMKALQDNTSNKNNILNDKNNDKNKDKNKDNNNHNNTVLNFTREFNGVIKRIIQILHDINNINSNKKENKKIGRVYTKKSICRFINSRALVEYSKTLGKINSKSEGLKILDPSCGLGFFLIDFIFLLYEHKSYDEPIKDLIEKRIYGIDIDSEKVEILKKLLKFFILSEMFEINNFDNFNAFFNLTIDEFTLRNNLDNNFCINIEPKDFLLEYLPDKSNIFDIIIGNPPYIRVHKMKKTDKEFLRQNFFSPYQDFDIYICFFEKGIKLLKKNGILGFITPDKFLSRNYAKKLRYFFLKTSFFLEIIDLSRNNDIFKADIYPVISIITKFKDFQPSTRESFNENETDSNFQPLLPKKKNKNENNEKGMFPKLFTKYLKVYNKFIESIDFYEKILDNEMPLSHPSTSNYNTLDNIENSQDQMVYHKSNDFEFEMFNPVFYYSFKKSYLNIFEFPTNKTYKKLIKIFNNTQPSLNSASITELNHGNSLLVLKNFSDEIDIVCGTPRAKFYKSLKKSIIEIENTANGRLKIEKDNNKSNKYIVSRNIFPYIIKWGIPINSLHEKYQYPYFKLENSVYSSNMKKVFNKTPKILIKANSKRICAAISHELYVFNGIYALYLRNNIKNNKSEHFLQILVAILNSNLINFYIIHKFQSYMVSSKYLSINSNVLNSVPLLPEIFNEKNTEIINLINSIEKNMSELLNFLFSEHVSFLNQELLNVLLNNLRLLKFRKFQDGLNEIKEQYNNPNLDWGYLNDVSTSLSNKITDLNNIIYDMYNIPEDLVSEINDFMEKI